MHAVKLGLPRPICSIRPIHYRHGGRKARRILVSFAPFTVHISEAAASARHSLISVEGEESLLPPPFSSLFLQVCP
jgi:hypothetical protein